jgi:hypothetical protein
MFNSKGTRLEGNLIGTDLSGAFPLPNGRHGVEVVGGSSSISVFGNTVAYNGVAGVAIGVDPTDSSNDDGIESNSIHDNGALGIDLGSDGVTPNNACDAGRGPNLGQNFPVLASAVLGSGSVDIVGTVNSVPNTRFLIDFYSNRLCSKSGYGEGETYLGSTTASTGPTCDATFDATFVTTVPAGSFITATATDPAGNTSEFSACLPVSVGLDFNAVVPCRLADTRNAAGPLGGPPLSSGAVRTFQVGGNCGLPVDARAVGFNFTVTQPTTVGNLEIAPVAPLLPMPPTVWYSAGQTRAANAILPLGPNGEIAVQTDQNFGTVDLIIDVMGYFR